MFVASSHNTMRNVVKPATERRPVFIERITPEKREARRHAHELGVPEWVAVIIYSVAREHGQSVRDILSKRKTTPLVRAREQMMYELRAKGRDHRSITLRRIGAWTSRDPTSVSYAVGWYALDNGLPQLTTLDVEARRLRASSSRRQHWKETEKAEVGEMLKQEMTAEQIASNFDGRSKMAVIGLVNRDPALMEIGFRHNVNGRPRKAA